MSTTRTITATYLRQHVYEILDEVLITGKPIEIDRNGRTIRIESAPAKKRELNKLPRREGVYRGEPDDLVHLDWSGEWNPDLP